MGQLCLACTYRDINADKWLKCPHCGNRNTDFIIIVGKEDFISVISDGETDNTKKST